MHTYIHTYIPMLSTHNSKSVWLQHNSYWSLLTPYEKQRPNYTTQL